MTKKIMLLSFVLLAGLGLYIFWPAAPASVDTYAADDRWLCLPGRSDACAGDFSATTVNPDGSTEIEVFSADDDAPIDCFYLYPTVSTDLAGNSDWDVDLQETGVAAIQAARLRSVCKVYAPIYRQVTLTALAARRSGLKSAGDPALADGDVLAAWQYYLAQYNQGRPVVLLGHSQGTRRLQTLLPKAVLGTDITDRLLGVYMIGLNVLVDQGDPTPAPFEGLPLCSALGELGCAVAYVSFRETAPPTTAPAYGVTEEAGKQVACVNPAAPGERGFYALDAYMPSEKLLAGRTASSERRTDWAEGVATVDTAFVKLPGLLSGACQTSDTASYFAIRVHGDPDDARADDISGDLIINGTLIPQWGLHLIDMNLALGNLVEMIRAQRDAWAAGGP